MAMIRYGISPWIHRVPSGRRPSYPRLRGHHQVDVAIIGGGLTGCLTAQALATAGLSTIVLEARRVGEGATGHASGLALLEPQLDLVALRRARGLRFARRAWRSCRRTTQDLAATLRRLNGRCHLMRGDLHLA